MKKLLYLILLFLVFHFTGFTQTDTSTTITTTTNVAVGEKPTFKNQLDIDVEALALFY